MSPRSTAAEPTSAEGGSSWRELAVARSLDPARVRAEKRVQRFLDAALERYPDIIAIIITGFGTVKDAVNAIKQGAADFITKPFKLPALLIAVERALRERRMRREIVRLRRELGDDRGTLVAAREGGRLTGEERLREQLGDLYGKVNGYDGHPTNGQIALADVLDGELKKGEADFEAMLAKDLPPLNSGLKGKKLPEITRESREDWNKRTSDATPGTGGLEAAEQLMWFEHSLAGAAEADDR